MSKWTQEVVEMLEQEVGIDKNVEVSIADVSRVSESLTSECDSEFSTRSVASKLRNMGYSVEKVAKKGAEFTEDQANDLRDFVEANSGNYTYGELAAALFGGKYTTRQIQGKLLHMDLTEHVKPTEKKEVVKEYTEEQEEKFLALVEAGAFIEDIAEALGKSINSVRGKALSINRKTGLAIPKMRTKKSPIVDAFEQLDDVSNKTVAEIAEELGKTERGVKTMLTRRAVNVKDYKGADKHEKAEAKKAEQSED